MPGSDGEHHLQVRYGTCSRAEAFYKHQVLAHLNAPMCAFIARQDMFFVATCDAQGKCDISFRAGPAGFVLVLNETNLIYPEFRGNGVMASLGNVSENPHASMIFVDFIKDKIGLHVNGAARILSNEELLTWSMDGPLAWPEVFAAIHAVLAETGGRRPERWVMLSVEEAYVHCSKHIPRLTKVGEEVRDLGTDDPRAKGGNYFQTRSSAGRPR